MKQFSQLKYNIIAMIIIFFYVYIHFILKSKPSITLETQTLDTFFVK